MPKNRIEVEMKFKVEDHERIRGMFPGPWSMPQIEEDLYFNHPSWNLLTTDEWLRVRTEYRNIGEPCCFPTHNLVYKGPKMSDAVKSRQEIDLPIDGEITTLLKLLGFKPLVEVRKTRSTYSCPEYPYITITLDDVEGLGKYVEIEALMDIGQEDVGAKHVQNMAEKLGLKNPEQRGYAKLLLEKSSCNR